MATEEKREIDFELLKTLIAESGLSTMDLISKIIGTGKGTSCSACDNMCQTCHSGCQNGPTPSRGIDQYIIYPHELERLKREIIAELRG